MSYEIEDYLDDTLEHDGLYHTQGGGLVRWDELNKAWVFVEAPPDFPRFKAGDFMPKEWSIA